MDTCLYYYPERWNRTPTPLGQMALAWRHPSRLRISHGQCAVIFFLRLAVRGPPRASRAGRKKAAVWESVRNAPNDLRYTGESLYSWGVYPIWIQTIRSIQKTPSVATWGNYIQNKNPSPQYWGPPRWGIKFRWAHTPYLVLGVSLEPPHTHSFVRRA